jgi:hypothetical protein
LATKRGLAWPRAMDPQLNGISSDRRRMMGTDTGPLTGLPYHGMVVWLSPDYYTIRRGRSRKFHTMACQQLCLPLVSTSNLAVSRRFTMDEALTKRVTRIEECPPALRFSNVQDGTEASTCA